MLLVLEALGGVIALVIALAVQFGLAELGLLAATAAQLALLLSPAVYRRTLLGGGSPAAGSRCGDGAPPCRWWRLSRPGRLGPGRR